MRKPCKLTKKTALMLIQRFFPALPKTLISGPTGNSDAVIFTALTGPDGLEVKVENDWFSQNGCIKLTISDPLGGTHMTMYFDPSTFERDYSAEDLGKEKAAIDARKQWVQVVGRERAHELVEQYWGK